MVGRPGHWRSRVGDYRMIYTVEGAAMRVLVVEVAYRREVYR